MNFPNSDFDTSPDGVVAPGGVKRFGPRHADADRSFRRHSVFADLKSDNTILPPPIFDREQANVFEGVNEAELFDEKVGVYGMLYFEILFVSIKFVYNLFCFLMF